MDRPAVPQRAAALLPVALATWAAALTAHAALIPMALLASTAYWRAFAAAHEAVAPDDFPEECAQLRPAPLALLAGMGAEEEAEAKAAAGEAAAECSCDGSAPSGPLSLSDLEEIGLLGVGTFGTVRLMADSRLGEKRPFALKTLRKSLLVRHKQVAHVVSEASLMSECEHPFIARLEAVFETAAACHLLMEPVMGGELFTLMHVRKVALAEADAVLYGAMVISALEYLHAMGVAYRDLKPENLLLDRSGFLKLVDFGFAKRLTDGRTFTQCGTPEYMAPEVLLNEGHGVAVDWWALGILLYEMMAGHPPFRDRGDEADLCRRIVSAQPTFPSKMGEEARSLVSRLLCSMPCDRLGSRGAGEVKSHPLLAGVAWKALLACTVRPPLTPLLAGDFDVSCFEPFDDVHAVAVDAEPTTHLPQGMLDGIAAHWRQLRRPTVP